MLVSELNDVLRFASSIYTWSKLTKLEEGLITLYVGGITMVLHEANVREADMEHRMPMNKKDFEGVARVLKEMHGRALTTREHTLVDRLAGDLAKYFKNANSAFNRDKFLDAADFGVHVPTPQNATGA